MNDTKYCDGYCLIDFGDEAFAEIARSSGHIPDKIVIPSSFNGHPVTGVGFPKFYIEEFKRLVLPETVRKLRFAFGYDSRDINALKKVDLSSVTRIGDMAFTGCCTS